MCRILLCVVGGGGGVLSVLFFVPPPLFTRRLIGNGGCKNPLCGFAHTWARGWNKASNFNNGVKPKYLTRTSILSNFNTGDLNFSYLIMWVPPTTHRTDKPSGS